MPNVEIDVTAVVAIWMTSVLVLVPLLGAVVRWAVVPLLEAAARYRAAGGSGGVEELRERFARQERRLAELARVMERMDATETRF